MFPRREALSLDGAWECIPDPERTLVPDRLPSGRPITVPGAWEAHLPDPYGIVHAWYRRKVSIPAGWRDGSLILRFGSAMARAEVGLFSGWVHAPAAVLADHEHGAGRLIATTLRLAPQDGPVVTAMLESLIQRAGRRPAIQ